MPTFGWAAEIGAAFERIVQYRKKPSNSDNVGIRHGNDSLLSYVSGTVASQRGFKSSSSFRAIRKRLSGNARHPLHKVACRFALPRQRRDPVSHAVKSRLPALFGL